MKGQRDLVNNIRSVMEPVNPVPASAYESDTLYQADLADRIAELRLSEQTQPGRDRREGSRGAGAWRVAAPALSGLAVVAVVVSLALAGGSANHSAGQHHLTGPAAAAGSPPRYYVTINNKGFLTFKPSMLIVHSTLTGKTIASLKLPKSKGLYGWVTAAKSDREFYIVGDRTPGHFLSAAGLYRLRLAQNGRVASFTTLSTNLGIAEADNIDGIALSPDGTKLAVAVEITHGYTPQAEIEVIPLSRAPARVWIDRQFGEYPWYPVWTSNKDIAFLWWDHLKKPYADFIARVQERLLNTAAPGSSLLSSRVLVTASDKLGFIGTALAAPRGGPIIAGAATDVPAIGPHGKATVRLVAISPKTGKVIKVFFSHVVRYHTTFGRANANVFYRVTGLDASGRDVLGYYPHFGYLTGGVVTPLPSGPGLAVSAAW